MRACKLNHAFRVCGNQSREDGLGEVAMEAAEYIRDERGEAQGVRMEVAEYEAAKRKLREAERTTHALESIFIDLIKTIRESDKSFYDAIRCVEEQLVAEGRDPEYVEEMMDLLEDLQARVAFDEDEESLDDDDFVDLEVFKDEIESERNTE